MDHEYEFYVVIKTTSGSLQSNKVAVRTHKMDNLTGIKVAFGTFEEPEPAVTELKELVERMNATWSDEVDADTTHLLAQLPGGSNYEKAMRYSIPIVKPDWLVQCDRNKKIQVIEICCVVWSTCSRPSAQLILYRTGCTTILHRQCISKRVNAITRPQQLFILTTSTTTQGK